MTSNRPQPFLGRIAEQVSAPGRTVMIASAVLFVFGAISTVFSQGKIVHVTTNAPGAQVVIDGRVGEQVDATTWRFDGVPWGTRNGVAAHRDYISKASPLGVGAFGEGRFQIDMERRKVKLTVNTMPGAEVFLDGQTFGKANPSGVFFHDQIPAGEYLIAIQLAGYEGANFRRGVHDDENSFRAQLQITQAKREEIARQRDRAFELLQDASNLFGRRQYQAALTAVDESIRLFPDDYRAQQLRERIVETIKILQ